MALVVVGDLEDIAGEERVCEEGTTKGWSGQGY